MLRIRRAEAEDQTRCDELLAVAGEELRTLRGGELLASLNLPPRTHGEEPLGEGGEDWLEAAARDPARLVLVGEYEGAVVATAAVSVLHASGSDVARPGRIDWCYVEKEARGVGIGSALVEAALGWLADRGCTDVDAHALPGDRLTKQLFEDAGFKARLLVLHRQVR